jgi:hypothetical protein
LIRVLPGVNKLPWYRVIFWWFHTTQINGFTTVLIALVASNRDVRFKGNGALSVVMKVSRHVRDILLELD